MMTLKYMYRIAVLLIFLGAKYIAYSQTAIAPTNERKELQLKGNVKNLYEYWDEAIEKEGIVEVWDKARYQYWQLDKKGQITHCSIHLDGEMLVRNEYQYNEKGYRTQIIDWKKDTINAKCTYDYDFEKDQITEWRFEMQPSMEFKTVYIYSNEQLTTSIHYTLSGSVDARFELEYDKSGNILQEKSYESNGDLIGNSTYTYDKNGNMITESFFDAKGVPDGTAKYTYEYDKKGNWIKRIKYLKDKPFYIFERKIEYY